MDGIGKKAGLLLALLLGAGAAALCRAAVEGGWHPVTAASWTGGTVLAAASLAGWFVGGRYDRMKDWAERDALTRAFSRRFMRQVYPKLVARADKKNKRFTALLVDVNGFKAVNDSLGHAKGDDLLRKLAEEMREASRQGEIVGRWGGDEFLLLCPYGDKASLDAFQRKIGEHVARLAAEWNRPLSVSIGSAVYPDDGRVLEELAMEADRRMYAEKNRLKDSLRHRLNA